MAPDQPSAAEESDASNGGSAAAPTSTWAGTFYLDDYCPMACERDRDGGLHLYLGDASTVVEMTFTVDGLTCLEMLLGHAVVAMLRRRNVLRAGPDALTDDRAATKREGCQS